MKQKSSPLFLLSFLLLIFMSSCREPKDLEYRGFSNLRLDKLGFDASKLMVDLQYYNPNNFSLDLNRADLDVFIDSTLVGHSAQNVQINIPKRDVFTLPIVIDLDMKNLLKNSILSLFSKEVQVRLIGKVKLGKAGVYKNFKVDYTTRQNFSLFR